MSQLTFAIDNLIHEADVAATPAWDGAPLRYHETYSHPEDLEAAFERYQFEHGRFGSIPKSHMWHRSAVGDQLHLLDAPHSIHLLGADTRCTEPDHEHADGELHAEYMYQAVCPPCEWHHISSDENTVVEAWHDHAIPRWRTLPVVPQKLGRCGESRQARLRLADWITQQYPDHMQKPGYPIITDRGPGATRHHFNPSSPLGGFDLSATGR